MIRKFISIKGTGKFLNYCPSNIPNNIWNGEFKKSNLIYGENGSGKTTLSFLFRSLRNDNSLLLRKRSFDTSVEQSIDILTDAPANQRISYSNGSWSHHVPNIEIFDIHFINDNIYTGSEIQNDHKKNLLEVIFGQQGIRLKEEISILKEAIQNNNRDLRNIITRIESSIENTFNADDYSNIQIDPLIDSKIQLKESEINSALHYNEIQQKNPLSTISNLTFPIAFEEIEILLQKSIDSISQEYINKFREHCDYLGMDNTAEEWITRGYNSIKNEECPFCLRTLDDSIDIFVAYKQYFNDEYKELNINIISIKDRVQNIVLESFFFNLENNLSRNSALFDYWKNYIPSQIEFDSILIDRVDLIAAFQELKNIVLEKSLNLVESKPIDSILLFQEKMNDLNDRITQLNQQISEYNRSIAELKNRNQFNLPLLQNELKSLKAIKKRSDNPIYQDCTEYTRIKTELERQNTEKDTKQTQLTAYSTVLFDTYATSINNYLRAFAPYLQIKDLESRYVGLGRDPIINYALQIEGNNISISDSPTQHSFKYCFSEGDKSALALAFFLAKLENNGNLNNKIIVFDDPISSFDLNRKTATITQLSIISQNAEQLFILTHNIVFAGEVWNELHRLTSQCIKIGYLNNSSVLTSFDIKYETLASVLKDSLLMKEYIHIGTTDEQVKRAVARAIRPALESYYHLKFFDFVSDDEWLGNFISQVRMSQPTDIFYRMKSSLNELTDINTYSKRFHHRFNTNADNEPIVEGELRTYCQRTLNLIQII